MELLELLKKLKKIEPDASYSRHSKKIILFGEKTALPQFTFWRILTEGIKSGSAIVLASVALIVILGGFSLWKIFSPYSVSSLDPVGLRAEAQNVNIQIQLTNIAYNEGVNSSTAETSTSSPATKNTAGSQETQTEVKEKAAQIGLPLPSSTTVGIDGALEEMSK